MERPRVRMDALPVPLDSAGFRVHESDDRAQEARLAGAVAARDLEILTTLHSEREPAQNMALATENVQGRPGESMHSHPRSLTSGLDQDSLSAVVTGRRAARSAGASPPMSPIASAQRRPVPIRAGDTSKRNTTWLKLAPRVDTA